VLAVRFPRIPLVGDVRELRELPAATELLAAGFPCQDLSQAGKTIGISGKRSGLVGEVFRLLRKNRVPWVLLENVPFMLQLGSGAAMNFIVEKLESLGYRWAYRVIDTRAFGLPQRRERVFILASTEEDPAPRLFRGAMTPREPGGVSGKACGFFWTEGIRGLGWAVDAVPTLTGGSTVGIPSPPAIWFPDGRIATPDLRDAERLQGFEPDWTKPVESVARAGFRWKLVGNAVTVNVAQWVGERLAAPADERPWGMAQGTINGSWPKAAFGSRKGRFAVATTTWPVARKQPPLTTFLRFPPKLLSMKGTRGFYDRLTSGTLRYPEEFGKALREHMERLALEALA
jgi:DNA (cytosine-5)-methyltransferase 1